MSTIILMGTTIVKLEGLMHVDRGTHEAHYVRVSTLKERIQRVLDEGRVENANWWSERAGLTRTHVRGMLNGEHTDAGRIQLWVIEALATIAGVSPAWLGYGFGGPDDDPPIGTMLLKLARIPKLQDVIERHPERWRTSTVARACTETFQSDSDGVPLGGWEKALDAIESGRAKKTSGSVVDIARATRKQVGRRPRVPSR